MNTFDTNRFKKMLAYDLKQARYTYGKALLVAVLAPVMWWLMLTLLNSESGMTGRLALLYAIYLGALMVAPSRLYARVNQGNKGIYYAMLPASKQEKYLSMWLICAVILPIVLAIALLTVDTLLATMPFGAIQNNIDFYAENFNHSAQRYLWQLPKELDADIFADIFSTMWNEHKTETILTCINTIVGLHLFISYFMLTNTIFKKSKTIFAILLMWGTSIVISPFSLMVSPLDENTSVTTFIAITAVVNTVLAAVLYYCTYRRLNKMAY